MWTALRVMGILGAVVLVLIAAGLAMMTVVAFQYGINRENGLAFGLIGLSLLIGILKRRDIAWLVRYGITGDRDRNLKSCPK